MEELKAGTVLDKMVQSANIWIKDLMYELNLKDPDQAYHLLGSILQALRDRLPAPEASHLGAQLPMIVRGMYYENWKMADKPLKLKDRESFFEHVEEIHNGALDVAMEDAVRAVFKLLRHHVSEGEAKKTEKLLPAELQELWPQEQTS